MDAEQAHPVGGFELGTDGPTAIVVGVDGSQTAMRALAYAVGLARRQHSRLVAVYVRRFVPGVFAFADRTGAASQAARQPQDDVEAQLTALFGQADEWRVDATLVVRCGDPLAHLAQVAEELRADAVIVGSSASIGHRIAGSLAVRLVRAGRWPVTVVP